MRRGMHAVLECARTTQKDRFEAGSAGVTWQIFSKTLEQDRILLVHRSFRPRGCGTENGPKLNETAWKSVPLPTRPRRDLACNLLRRAIECPGVFDQAWLRERNGFS